MSNTLNKPIYNPRKFLNLKNVTCCIYKITDTRNNKVYIGLTRRALTQRINNHFTEYFSRKNKKNKCYIHNVINKFGCC